jgi:wolfamin
MILLAMAKRERWHGSYKYAIPHCVILSWLQIFIINSQGATMYGLVRGTLALVGMFLFLPIMGVATVFLPIFAVIKLITLSDVLYMISLGSGVMIALLITCLLAKNETMKKYVTPLQVS